MLNDQKYMREALLEASEAARCGEVPIGALIVREGKVIVAERNRREEYSDPTAHAEILAIRQAGKILGGWRLSGCTLFVTLEPCPMCAGAMVQARLDRLVFGAKDPKGGAAGTLYNIVQDVRLNHRLIVTGGILEEECADELQYFFRQKRE